MFTGIVEEVGSVRSVAPGRLEIACRQVVVDAAVGDSISVNGCCLTVVGRDDDGFATDVMGETLERTALGDLGVGDPVNLERALRADGRLGGHLVQGHVDGVGEVLALDARGSTFVMTCALPHSLARYVVEKGSVCVDGTSLTVMAVRDADRGADGPGTGQFDVGLIPHTLAATVHGRRQVGDRVNLEVDVVAKYVERMLNATRS